MNFMSKLINSNFFFWKWYSSFYYFTFIFSHFRFSVLIIQFHTEELLINIYANKGHSEKTAKILFERIWLTLRVASTTDLAIVTNLTLWIAKYLLIRVSRDIKVYFLRMKISRARSHFPYKETSRVRLPSGKTSHLSFLASLKNSNHLPRHPISLTIEFHLRIGQHSRQSYDIGFSRSVLKSISVETFRLISQRSIKLRFL